MNSMMQKIIECQEQAAITWAMVQNSNKIMENYEACGPPTTHCFRIPVKHEVVEGSNLPFSQVSIAHPPDTDLDVFEIALFNNENKLIYVDYLGMSDIYRFSSFSGLEDGLTKLANNLSVTSDPVYTDDTEEEEDDDFLLFENTN